MENLERSLLVRVPDGGPLSSGKQKSPRVTCFRHFSKNRPRFTQFNFCQIIHLVPAASDEQVALLFHHVPLDGKYRYGASFHFKWFGPVFVPDDHRTFPINCGQFASAHLQWFISVLEQISDVSNKCLTFQSRHVTAVVAFDRKMCFLFHWAMEVEWPLPLNDQTPPFNPHANFGFDGWKQQHHTELFLNGSSYRCFQQPENSNCF